MSLPRQYFFRRLKSKIYTLCFFLKSFEQTNIREQVYFNLIKLMFYSEGNYKNKFVHYTQSQSELSLFVDKASLDKFTAVLSPEAKEFMNLGATCFKAVEVYTDQNDLETPGVTAFISSRLAECAIPLVYCNSVNSSFVLVPEKYLAQANAVFRSIAEGREEEEDD